MDENTLPLAFCIRECNAVNGQVKCNIGEEDILQY